MKFPNPSLPPILIVDDCEDDVFLLRHRLREGGIANPIATFTSTAEALTHLHFLPAGQPKPFLMFTDIRMPNECGFELISRIRDEAEWDDMKIAVMTSSNQPADLERALEHGVAGYLIKFPPADLLAEFVTSGPWFAVASHTKSLTNPLSA
jgi:CheY-like chemotaxis protein